MARDIEADAVINDKSSEGLRKFEENVRKSGKKVEKDYDRLGKGLGESILGGIGAVSPKLAASLANSFGDAARLGAPLLLAGVAAAAPLIGGLIGAAVTGGAAGAGIVGGVLVAAKDARVQAAGKALGANLLAGLQDRAGSFVAPVLKSIDLIQAQFTKSGDKIRGFFENTARFVEPLTVSVGKLGDSLISGLEKASGRAGPVMREINAGIEGTGRAIESFLDNVSASQEGNAAALRDTFDAINGTIIAAGGLVRALSEVYGVLSQLGLTSGLVQQLAHAFDDTEDAARRGGGGSFAAGNAMQIAGDQAEAAAKDTQLFERALRENAQAAEQAARAQSSLFDDTTRVGAAMDDAAAAARRNGKTLDANTAKGRANRSALSALASAQNTYRNNLETSGASAAKVNGVMSQQRAALIRVAGQMGVTGRKAQQLADQLLGIPAKRETKTNLLNDAATKREARQVKAAVESIPRNYSVNISVITRGLTQAREAANLRREMLLNSTGATFGLTVPGDASRIGGPSPVHATISNAIYLDGQPFRDWTDNRIRAYDARQRHWRKYGGKH